MIDEPLVVPVSPGAALVRLAQVSGALQRHPVIADTLPNNTLARLETGRDNLWRALESNEPAIVETSLRNVQDELRRIYEAVSQSSSGSAQPTSDGAINPYTALGFPDPTQSKLQPIDVKTVIATFAKPVRQVLTTISFQDAVGATAYWLQEIRCPYNEERLEDYILESFSPLFPRVRLPVGTHIFRIESRDNSDFILSDEFTIEVPSL